MIQDKDSLKKSSEKLELPCRISATIQDPVILKTLCDIFEMDNIKYTITNLEKIKIKNKNKAQNIDEYL